MPDTDHYILKRSGWLLLLFVTRLSATMFHECACTSFLIRDLENAPPSSQSSPRDRRCESCKRRSKRKNVRWERRARARGTKTPLGTLMWKDEERRERIKVVFKEVVLGGMVVAGCLGLWKMRGVWGWWGVPAGFGVWGALGMEGFWDDGGEDDE
ncbi:hypothetical protein OCU04_000084 [Sclerotinia nivalis]|uniref:Uncharacterized protein n=1 Tax=Sclerotinia nivalis TaxID=352851 RepID=A0A9X0AVD3_9HELO|nr:hypothetical protein OCU04_000084 [Sclerotinia nivalis]